MKLLFDEKRQPLIKRMVLSLMSLLPMRQKRTILFFRVHKRLPRLRKPQTFSEKMNWRILYDRRPELAWTCDKLAAKAKVSSVCPAVRVPCTYWSGTDLRELSSVDLPSGWILKPNAGCGLVLKGGGPVGEAEAEELLGLTDGWLDQDLASATGEWAYTQSKRCFLVEELIGDGLRPPTDYKALVFGQKVLSWYVIEATPTGRCVSFFTPEWSPLNYAIDGFENCPNVKRPSNLEEMNSAAEAIAGGLDFLRVDLYEVDCDIWFGETTPYPSSGLVRYHPKEVNAEWGEHWDLPNAG